MTDTAVLDLYRRLLTAWNERDASGLAALFAPDAAMIGFDGSQVAGAGVAAHLGPIFGDHPTASYVAKLRGTRPVGGSAVLLQAIAGMVPPGGDDLNPALNVVHTVVAEQHDGGWWIVLFQNTPAQHHGDPEAADAHLAELRAVRSAGAVLA